MVLGEKRWLFSIGNGAEILHLEKGRKSPVKGYSLWSVWCEKLGVPLYGSCVLDWANMVFKILIGSVFVFKSDDGRGDLRFLADP